MAAIPTPDLAVPYEAPRQVKTMDAVQPIAPKKGYMSMVSMGDDGFSVRCRVARVLGSIDGELGRWQCRKRREY